MPKKNGVRFILVASKKSLPSKSRVVDDKGDAVTPYDKLLLATGGRPRRFPFGDGQIIYFRTYWITGIACEVCCSRMRGSR